jgi:hypothetical protein
MTPAAPAAPAPSPAKVRLCRDGCGRALPRGSKARYVWGHAPNFPRSIDSADLSPAVIGAFWFRVRLADNGMCWEWVGLKTKRGYGQLKDPITHVRYLAHRLAYALLFSPVPAGIQVMHWCDVSGYGPGCVNPFHTRLGTHSENLRDAAAVGFMRRKLTASDVLKLRELRQAGAASNRALAKRFGISINQVTNITRGYAWQHLVDPEAPPLSTAKPWARKATCPSGHPYTPENSVMSSAYRGRRCLACIRLRIQARTLDPAYQEKREERLAYFREYDRTRRPRRAGRHRAA